jgi:hypothetical protein
MQNSYLNFSGITDVLLTSLPCFWYDLFVQKSAASCFGRAGNCLRIPVSMIEKSKRHGWRALFPAGCHVALGCFFLFRWGRGRERVRPAAPAAEKAGIRLVIARVGKQPVPLKTEGSNSGREGEGRWVQK